MIDLDQIFYEISKSTSFSIRLLKPDISTAKKYTSFRNSYISTSFACEFSLSNADNEFINYLWNV